MQQLLWQHKALTQNVVPSEPHLGSSRTFNVTDLPLPRSQAMAGIGPTVSNSWKQSLKILTGMTKKKKKTPKLFLINILLPLFFNIMYDWAFSPVASLLSAVKWIFLFVLWQVHSLFQSKLSTQYDLMLSLSICSIFSFIYVHPVATYIFFLIFLSLFSFAISFHQ